MFVNRMPRYEILSEDSMATLDRGWRRIVSEIGIEFLKPEALDLFRAAGQKVEGDNVFFDPDWVLAQVAKAPREFDIQARNPANNVHIGGDHMVFSSVYGPPFVRDGDVRREGTFEDYRNFAKLAQSFTAIDSVGGVVAEPNDTPLDSRHLDMLYATLTLTDKMYMGNVVSGVNARDTIAMGEICLRRPRVHRADAGEHLADQLQLSAAVGRPNARRAVRVLSSQPARRADAVPAHGGDVAGNDPVSTRAADRGGAHRYCALAADPSRCAGGLRVVPLEHRHAVRLTAVRDAGVGHGPAVHRADRSTLRSALPWRWRA